MQCELEMAFSMKTQEDLLQWLKEEGFHDNTVKVFEGKS